MEHTFNYEDAKITFNQEVGCVLIEKKLQTKVVQHKKTLDDILIDIKLHRLQYMQYFTEKCEIVNENGKNILCQVFTRLTDTKPFYAVEIKQIICLDELFDILSELHMVKPYLDKAGILEHLSNCLVHEIFVILFWKTCESCNSIGKIVDMNSKMVGEITVFTLDASDEKFTHILMYIERNTNFVFLRPLNALSVTEIAYELLKIFTDFGPPTFLDSDILMYLKDNGVLDILKLLEPPFRLPVMYKRSRHHKIKVTTIKAKELLNNWMKTTGSTNWAVGVVVVQWLMNTNLIVDTYIKSRLIEGPKKSPYHALFGMLPHTDIVKFKEKRKSQPTKSKDKVLIDCSQCRLPIYKVFKCHFCLRSFHFTCCSRFVRQTPETPVFINKCLSCETMCGHQEVVLGS